VLQQIDDKKLGIKKGSTKKKSCQQKEFEDGLHKVQTHQNGGAKGAFGNQPDTQKPTITEDTMSIIAKTFHEQACANKEQAVAKFIKSRSKYRYSSIGKSW